MNSECETLSNWKPILHVTATCVFKRPIEQASNALKLWSGSYGEINRGPRLRTEYISHQSNFKINSTFDKQPIHFPCDLSDMLRLLLWVRFWQPRCYARWNSWRTPPPHFPPQGKPSWSLNNSVSVRSLTHGPCLTVRALIKMLGTGQKSPRPKSSLHSLIYIPIKQKEWSAWNLEITKNKLLLRMGGLLFRGKRVRMGRGGGGGTGWELSVPGTHI